EGGRARGAGQPGFGVRQLGRGGGDAALFRRPLRDAAGGDRGDSVAGAPRAALRAPRRGVGRVRPPPPPRGPRAGPHGGVLRVPAGARDRAAARAVSLRARRGGARRAARRAARRRDRASQPGAPAPRPPSVGSAGAFRSGAWQAGGPASRQPGGAPPSALGVAAGRAGPPAAVGPPLSASLNTPAAV